MLHSADSVNAAIVRRLLVVQPMLLVLWCRLGAFRPVAMLVAWAPPLWADSGEAAADRLGLLGHLVVAEADLLGEVIRVFPLVADHRAPADGRAVAGAA